MYDVSQSHSASDRISEANKLPAFGVEKSCFLIAKGTTCCVSAIAFKENLTNHVKRQTERKYILLLFAPFQKL